MLKMGVCPLDVADTAEAYLMKTLPPAEANSFGEHYPVCKRCFFGVGKGFAEFFNNLTLALGMLKVDAQT
jgi:hypothetical protein